MTDREPDEKDSQHLLIYAVGAVIVGVFVYRILTR